MSGPMGQREAEQTRGEKEQMEQAWTRSNESIDEWKDEIELFFDCQTSVVHQWIEIGDVTEVSVVFPPEEDVRGESNDGNQGESILGELIVHHPLGSEDSAEGENEEEGGKNASTSSFVEEKKREALILVFVFDE